MTERNSVVVPSDVSKAGVEFTSSKQYVEVTRVVTLLNLDDFRLAGNSMYTVFLDDDQTFCGQLSDELGSLGLVTQSLHIGQDWGSEVRSDSQVLLICIHGLGNRLAALRRVAGIHANQGAVLLATNLGYSFASLCFELGAHAVLNRRDSPEQLAPMIALLASAAGPKAHIAHVNEFRKR